MEMYWTVLEKQHQSFYAHSFMIWSHSSTPFHVLEVFYSRLDGAMKLKICHNARLEVCYCLESFFAESNFSDFGQKPWTIIRRFDRNRGYYLWSIYSTVEGAMKLKFASFCSS